MGDPDFRIRRYVYDQFCNGAGAPSKTAIAVALKLPIETVKEHLWDLSDAHVLVLSDDGEIIMAPPFSAVPTSSVVEAAGRQWFGNCIWDAFGILAMMRVDGTVRTQCADCDVPLSASVRDGKLDGDTGVVHFALPPAQWWNDIVFT